MPIGYNKTPFTLQEKIDKAIQVTYDIRNVQDAEFMRSFLVELLEKAFTKIQQDVEKRDGVYYQDKIKYPDKDVVDTINNLKNQIQ